jgi:hypothetical protein
MERQTAPPGAYCYDGHARTQHKISCASAAATSGGDEWTGDVLSSVLPLSGTRSTHQPTAASGSSPSTAVVLPWTSLNGQVHEPLWLVFRLAVVGYVSAQSGLSRKALSDTFIAVLSADDMDVLVNLLLSDGVLAEETMSWSSSSSSALMLGIHFRSVLTPLSQRFLPALGNGEETRTEVRAVEI